jgi:hypothetical protein
MMTGGARDIVNARQNWIEEKQPPQLDSLVIRCGSERVIGAQDHLWKLANQSSPTFTDTSRASVPDKIGLHWP